MKKHLFIRLVLLALLVAPTSCQEDEDSLIDIPENVSEELESITYDELEQHLGEVFEHVTFAPDKLKVIDSDVEMLDLSRIKTHSSVSLFDNMLVPTDNGYMSLPAPDIAARTNSFNFYYEVDRLEGSSSYKAVLKWVWSYVHNWDSKAMAYISEDLTNKAKWVASASSLSEYEKFSATQMILYTKAIAWRTFALAYDCTICKTTAAANDNCIKDKKVWRNVARGAIIAGGLQGISTGIKWAISGGVATAPSGNPIVGAVVGGVLGFAVGFTGGAIAGATVTLAAHCLVPDPPVYQAVIGYCNGSGKVLYMRSASPPQGYFKCSDERTTDVRMFLPNYGKANIDPNIISAINRLLYAR